MSISPNKSNYHSGVVTGGGGGRPKRHLLKGRRIEVSRNFVLSFSVQKTAEEGTTIFIPPYFFSSLQLKIESYFIPFV